MARRSFHLDLVYDLAKSHFLIAPLTVPLHLFGEETRLRLGGSDWVTVEPSD